MRRSKFCHPGGLVHVETFSMMPVGSRKVALWNVSDLRFTVYVAPDTGVKGVSTRKSSRGSQGRTRGFSWVRSRRK